MLLKIGKSDHLHPCDPFLLIIARDSQLQNPKLGALMIRYLEVRTIPDS